MPESVTPADRRASSVCAAALALQGVLLFVPILVFGLLTGSTALLIEVPHQAAGVAIWFVLLFVYRQRRRVAEERLETEELRRSRDAAATGAIFDTQREELFIQQRRLNWIMRWLLPTFTILLAVYHLFWFYFWPDFAAWMSGANPWAKTVDPTLALFVAAGVGFICFLFSRYTVGMAREPQWRLMRAGGGYVMGNALACLAIVVALGFKTHGVARVEAVVAESIRYLLLFVGLEFIVNLLLDFYRPRAATEVRLPSFDSRLLALASDPTGIARTIAEAVNYQFGFQVTGTWFFKLLQRWLVPLAAVTALALMALSSVVVIDADQQAIVETFGKRPTNGGVLPPGLHFKWPWPFETVHRASVEQIHEVVLGLRADEKEADQLDAPILWTEKHDFVPEMMLLMPTPDVAQATPARVAEPPPADADVGAGLTRGKAVGVSLLMVSVPIQYRIKNLADYLYKYEAPEALIESLAYRQLTTYGAGRDIQGIIGPQRATFSAEMRGWLQKELDEKGVGVEITFLGLQDAHPPADNEVAKTFQGVITAEQNKQAAIRTAETQAEVKLTQVGGSVARARQLDAAIQRLEALRSGAAADPAALKQAEQEVDELMLGNAAAGITPMTGAAAVLIADTQATQTRDVSLKQADATLFDNQLAAWKSAPAVFMMRQHLDVLEKSVQSARKWVVTSDPKKRKLVVILEAEKEATIDASLLEDKGKNP